MKNFLLFVLLLLYCNNFIEAQQIPTYAGIPGPENILVVYKVQSDPTDTLGAVSDSVKEYYRLARGIPAVNICPLNSLTSQTITIDGSTHRVIIAQNGDIIQDSSKNILPWTGANRHAWVYFLNNVSTPIRNWITSHNLTSTIRYIVLCKGVPYKIQAGSDWQALPGNLTVDGLLSILNTSNYDTFLLQTLFDAVNYQPKINNPYFDSDKNFTLDYRFLPDRFMKIMGTDTIKLSYLVSHLDGLSFEIVKGIIDSSKNADTTGTATWVLDDDDIPSTYHYSFFTDAKNKLEALGFNVNWNNDGKWITHNDGSVIGYSSWGTHAEDDNCAFTDSNWVKDSLQYFQFAPGAVFNSLESFNGNSIGVLKWRWIAPCSSYQNNRTQGLATQFTQIGGTGMMGHAWEPVPSYGPSGVIYNNIFMPAYAIGYNYVDAVYMGMKYLAWQNVIVGDPLTRILPAQVTKILTQDTTITSGDIYGKLIVPEGIKLTIPHDAIVNFRRNASLQIDGTLEIENEAVLNFYGFSNSKFDTANVLIANGTFNFYNNSYLTATNLTVGTGEHLRFNNKSSLSTDSLTIAAGAVLFFNDTSKLLIKHKLYAVGTESIKIRINSNNFNSSITISDANYVELTNAIINRVYIIEIKTHASNIASINIDNVEFNDMSKGLYLDTKVSPNSHEVIIKNSIIRGDNYKRGIQVFSVNNLKIENVTLFKEAPIDDSRGISTLNCKNVNISDCIISNFDYGISCGRDFKSSENPIVSGNFIIENNQINNCIEGIYFNDFQNIFPIIKKNIITSPKPVSENEKTSAIILMNGSEAAIESNTINDYDFGIQLLQVANPYIADNLIQILNNRGTAESGIFSNSSDGIYRLNHITRFEKGIDLGNSSPKIGQNIITDNKAAGLYISSGSIPDLSEGMIKREETVKVFPISGLNQIFENGDANLYNGAEIHMFDADILLGYGCNTIADNRIEQPGLNTRILFFSERTRSPIRANYNYWGNHPRYGNDPSHRIESDVEVNFEPYNNEPCTKQSDGDFVLIEDSKGETVIDTIYSLGLAVSADSISEAYALASKHFYIGNFTEAKQVYYGIIQTNGSDRKSIEAYTKLYTISKLTDTLASTFSELKSFYDNKLQSIQDTLMLKIVKHLSDLCLVAKKDYVQAINNFGEVITQNPNSEEAFFAAIDILTTSLLDSGNTAMSKVSGMDLSAKDANDYRTKLNALIRARNNKENILSSKIIPTDYSLYQNYPNPFNPTTKIQYDIPTDTKVELKIYDILGREVKTLVNEFQPAGRYSIDFNANYLASGVYVYQLSAKGFIKSRKMVIIK